MFNSPKLAEWVRAFFWRADELIWDAGLFDAAFCPHCMTQKLKIEVVKEDNEKQVRFFVYCWKCGFRRERLEE